jgi:hypothetical protein
MAERGDAAYVIATGATAVDKLTAALAEAADAGIWQATLPLVVQVSGRIPA